MSSVASPSKPRIRYTTRIASPYQHAAHKVNAAGLTSNTPHTSLHPTNTQHTRSTQQASHPIHHTHCLTLPTRSTQGQRSRPHIQYTTRIASPYQHAAHKVNAAGLTSNTPHASPHPTNTQHTGSTQQASHPIHHTHCLTLPTRSTQGQRSRPHIQYTTRIASPYQHAAHKVNAIHHHSHPLP